MEDRTDSSPAQTIRTTLTELVHAMYKLVAPMLGMKGVEKDSTVRVHDKSWNASRCAKRPHGPLSACPGCEPPQRGVFGSRALAVNAKCSRDETGCCYFTCLAVSEKSLPWYEEPEWESFSVERLKTASGEWLGTVGIGGGEEADLGPTRSLSGKNEILRDEREEFL